MDRILSDSFDSKFRVILLAAERAEQLMLGARPKRAHNTPKVARMAIEEVLDGEVLWALGPAPTSAIEDFEEELAAATGEAAASL